MDCSHQDLGSDSSNLFDFKDFKNPVDPILKYDENKYDDTLLIDNGKTALAQCSSKELCNSLESISGSYHCRMGWKSSQEFDKTSEDALVFKSVMVKTRKEKGKESELHVANGKVVKKKNT